MQKAYLQGAVHSAVARTIYHFTHGLFSEAPKIPVASSTNKQQLASKNDTKPQVRSEPVPATKGQGQTVTSAKGQGQDDVDGEELVKDTRVKFRDWDPVSEILTLFFQYLFVHVHKCFLNFLYYNFFKFAYVENILFFL